MQQRFPTTLGARSSAAPSSLRRGLRWARNAALALLAMGVSASAGNIACASNVQTGASSGGTCIGGLINKITGQCEAKCTPDKCLEGNTCVGNQCLLKCTSHTDCYAGSQSCAADKEDDTGADITVCKSNGLAAIGAACPFGDCKVTSCPDGKACDYAQCDGQPCTLDPIACGKDPACSIGLCPDNATACIVPACPQDQCKPLTCKTAGDADADAYCTLPDCMADADCPGGYFCGIVRDPHAICGTKKGNNERCGKTPQPCIDPAKKPPGTTYFEGSVCLLRKMCLKRDACTACQVDNDCSLVAGQRCIGTGPSGTDNRCEAACTLDKDCIAGYHCPQGSCVPLFDDGCHGTGKFCEPCQNDEDCGKKGSLVACVSMELTGERACVDYAFPDACMADVDCPLSPGGRHGHCLAEDDGVNPGDTAYHRCYLPYDPKIYRYGCW